MHDNTIATPLSRWAEDVLNSDLAPFEKVVLLAAERYSSLVTPGSDVHAISATDVADHLSTSLGADVTAQHVTEVMLSPAVSTEWIDIAEEHMAPHPDRPGALVIEDVIPFKF